MGFEVTYIFHPRKEGGGYNTESREEKQVKVGKPFDNTPLESAAAAIMAQLARRDIWVVDVKVAELVKKEVSFKECTDGKGITLKGKRFSFNEAAQMISEDVEEETPLIGYQSQQQPHEMIAASNGHAHNSNIDDLYANPNKPVPVQRQSTPQVPINQNKSIYKVIFDPPIQYMNEAKRMAGKFTVDSEYTVHQVIQHPLGKLELQRIAVTDDTGKAVIVDEKFFTTAGLGLLADKQLNFSGDSGRRTRKPRLQYENEMVMDGPDPNMGSMAHQGIPLDDGSIPPDLMGVPDIRAGRR